LDIYNIIQSKEFFESGIFYYISYVFLCNTGINAVLYVYALYVCLYI